MTLIAERDAQGRWRARSYGELAAAAQAVGQGLLDLGLGPGWPLLILSGNSADSSRPRSTPWTRWASGARTSSSPAAAAGAVLCADVFAGR